MERPAPVFETRNALAHALAVHVGSFREAVEHDADHGQPGRSYFLLGAQGTQGAQGA